MRNMSVLAKHELEAKLRDENSLITSGALREENPLDLSDDFNEFLEACRRGDLKRCQEFISAGVNVNGKDKFDYTPLIVASLCGHFDLVYLLLESGASAERNTFQGERCIYNALNDKIRKLLLEYDYSKSTDPLQPWSSHITSLLSPETRPKTADISLVVEGGSGSFDVHKFLLAARTPYFRKKLGDAASEPKTWKLASSVPIQSVHVILRYLYLGELPRDFTSSGSAETSNGVTTHSEADIFKGIDQISKALEVEHIWDAVLAFNDRRLTRQRYQDEVQRAQAQVETFFRDSILKSKFVIETSHVRDVKWPTNNAIFADCLLQVDEPVHQDEGQSVSQGPKEDDSTKTPRGEPQPAQNGNGTYQRNQQQEPRQSAIYPVHKAMLIRSPYFQAMFSGSFMEAQESEHLRIIKVDCSPGVLEVVLKFLYTEKVDCSLEMALDLLYAADMLLLDKLKTKAAGIISTLGSSNSTTSAVVAYSNNSNDSNSRNSNKSPSSKLFKSGPAVPSGVTEGTSRGEVETEPINVYDVIHAAWDLRVQRLEQFAARYIADRLEDYIDDPEFAELIQESASRLKNREETDTIELLDDIRYYLSERFRLRFEDAGWEEMMDENAAAAEGPGGAATTVTSAAAAVDDDNGAASAPPEGLAGLGGSPASGAVVASGDSVRAAAVDSGTTRINGPEGNAPDSGWVKTLDGTLVKDEFEADAANYQLLLKKIDDMLERLKLDA